MSRNYLFLILLYFSSPNIWADIIGGDSVESHDPIQSSIAALYSPSPDGKGGSLCTASLIGSHLALTAAHCVSPDLGSKGAKSILIFGNDIHNSGAPKRGVTAVKINRNWKSQAGRGMDQGDIALVKFEGNLPKGYHAIPIQKNERELKSGDSVVLAGYGISNAVTHSGAGKLRKTNVKILDSRPGATEMILDQTHGHGACHGDSGGPAYISKKGKLVLAGVTNRGYPPNGADNCAQGVVYTKVASLQNWIKKGKSALSNSETGDPYLGERLRRLRVRKTKATQKTMGSKMRLKISKKRVKRRYS